MFNVKSILDFLDKVTDVAKAAAPLATTLGIPLIEKVTGLVDTAVEIAKNAVERKGDIDVVINGKDEADITARIAKLDAINAELNNYIVNS